MMRSSSPSHCAQWPDGPVRRRSREHWPGTPQGLAAIQRLCRLPHDRVMRAWFTFGLMELSRGWEKLDSVLALIDPYGFKTLLDDQQAAIKDKLLQWRYAHGKLMNHIAALTGAKAANATLDKPVSYGNVNPEELIRTFPYGDSLHFGDAGEQLYDLLADPFHEAYYTYAPLLPIVGLSYAHFGVAVLLESARGWPKSYLPIPAGHPSGRRLWAHQPPAEVAEAVRAAVRSCW